MIRHIAAIAAVVVSQAAPTTTVDATEAAGFLGGAFLVWKMFEPIYKSLLERLPTLRNGNGNGSRRNNTPRPCPIADSEALQAHWESVADGVHEQTKILQAIHDSLQAQSADHKIQNILLERLDRRAD